MRRTLIGAGAAAVTLLAICGTTEAAPITQLPTAAVANIDQGDVIPAYYWRGRYYPYYWRGGYYPYYWNGGYYRYRAWRNGGWYYY